MQALMNCDWIGWLAQAVPGHPPVKDAMIPDYWWLFSQSVKFLAPGLIGWLITVVMTLGGKGGRGVIGLQFVFAMLIAVGALSYFLFDIREHAEWTMEMAAGSFDPWMETEGLFYSATTALWGLGIHLVTLVISLAIAPWAWRRGERRAAISEIGREIG